MRIDSFFRDHLDLILLNLAGFGMFLGDQLGGENDPGQEMIEHNPNEKEEQQLFHDTLDSLGAKDLYDDEENNNGTMDEIT